MNVRRLNRFAVCVIAAVSICVGRLDAVDDAKKPADAPAAEKPAQPGLQKDVKIISKEDPAFRFYIPKKRKVKALAERWRSVDLEVRKAAELAKFDKRVEELEKQDPKPEDQIKQLYQQRLQTQRRFEAMSCMLEVEGHPDETVAVYIESTNVADLKSTSESFMKQFEKWSGLKVHVDRDATSKSERKKGIERHAVDLVGRPEGGSDRRWLYVERMIRPGTGGSKYLITYVQARPAKHRDKQGLKEAQLLHRLLAWL